MEFACSALMCVVMQVLCIRDVSLPVVGVNMRVNVCVCLCVGLVTDWGPAEFTASIGCGSQGL